MCSETDDRRIPGLLAAPAVALVVMAWSVSVAQDDPFLWLEDIESGEALSWARANNDVTLSRLTAQPLFEPIYERNLEILNSDERIASPVQMGGFIYNFWRDAGHVRGIWRRTTVEAYRTEAPEWETLIDVDRLAADEGENWVWSGARCRYPDYDRCLVALSRGGADAAVVREFDLGAKEFVAGGFMLAEAKSNYGWRDRDSIFVGTDFGAGSLTDSGYPRLVRLWRRGTELSAATTLFAGDAGDVSVRGFRWWDGDDYVEIIRQATSFYTFAYFLVDGEDITRLALPEDADVVGFIDGQLLVALKSEWAPGRSTFAQGALLAVDVAALAAADIVAEVLFQPTARSSLAEVRRTRSTVVLNVLDNVVSRIDVVQREGAEWSRASLTTPGPGAIDILSTDLDSDRFYFSYTGFLTPPSLYEADAMRRTSSLLRSQPAFFDATGMRVEQRSARSADGTAIPYFLVTPDGFAADGSNPTLLYGYGGFEVSMAPSYSATVGSGWLERGGVYVLANIRGGGEFGPEWHQAALKENRQRAYDDFIAVAEDLIAREITSAEHLGIRGGSNGGLLVGAVFVQRPELFNAVVCQVPLLDMRRYHLLLAGASWMAEYGDPGDPDDWAFIGPYSPYQNVLPDGEYPEAYFFTSTRDDRVHPAHARKMVARMQEQGHPVLYYENIEGGHGGAANLNQSALNEALAYAYLHAKLGPASGR